MQLYLDRSPWRRWLKLNGVIRVGSSFDRTNVHIRSGASLCTHGGETTYRHSKKKTTVSQEKGPHQKHDHAGTLITDFADSKIVRNKCLASLSKAFCYSSSRRPWQYAVFTVFFCFDNCLLVRQASISAEMMMEVQGVGETCSAKKPLLIPSPGGWPL